MIDRDIMQQALEALEKMGGGYSRNLITALRERLAQPEMVLLDPEIGKIVFANLDKLYVEDPPVQQPVQEPVAWVWQGLTDEEWMEIDNRHDWRTTQGRIDAAEDIEAKLKAKNEY